MGLLGRLFGRDTASATQDDRQLAEMVERVRALSPRLRLAPRFQPRLEEAVGKGLVYLCGLVDSLAHPPDPPQPGDLVALDYLEAKELPGPWDHIVMFVEDRGPNGFPDGRVGAEDLVADIGSSVGHKFGLLSDQGAARLQLLRPRL